MEEGSGSGGRVTTRYFADNVIAHSKKKKSFYLDKITLKLIKLKFIPEDYHLFHFQFSNAPKMCFATSNLCPSVPFGNV